MQVDVRVGSERRTVGSAQDNADKRAHMRGALHRVAETVETGLFMFRDEAKWRFQTEFTSEEDWKEFAEKPTCGGIAADSRQLDEALARPDGCVILTEDNLASIYERLDATSP